MHIDVLFNFKASANESDDFRRSILTKFYLVFANKIRVQSNAQHLEYWAGIDQRFSTKHYVDDRLNKQLHK